MGDVLAAFKNAELALEDLKDMLPKFFQADIEGALNNLDDAKNDLANIHTWMTNMK